MPGSIGRRTVAIQGKITDGFTIIWKGLLSQDILSLLRRDPWKQIYPLLLKMAFYPTLYPSFGNISNHINFFIGYFLVHTMTQDLTNFFGEMPELP